MNGYISWHRVPGQETAVTNQHTHGNGGMLQVGMNDAGKHSFCVDFQPHRPHQDVVFRGAPVVYVCDAQGRKLGQVQVQQ